MAGNSVLMKSKMITSSDNSITITNGTDGSIDLKVNGGVGNNITLSSSTPNALAATGNPGSYTGTKAAAYNHVHPTTGLAVLDENNKISEDVIPDSVLPEWKTLDIPDSLIVAEGNKVERVIYNIYMRETRTVATIYQSLVVSFPSEPATHNEYYEGGVYKVGFNYLLQPEYYIDTLGYTYYEQAIISEAQQYPDKFHSTGKRKSSYIPLGGGSSYELIIVRPSKDEILDMLFESIPPQHMIQDDNYVYQHYYVPTQNLPYHINDPYRGYGGASAILANRIKNQLDPTGQFVNQQWLIHPRKRRLAYEASEFCDGNEIYKKEAEKIPDGSFVLCSPQWFKILAPYQWYGGDIRNTYSDPNPNSSDQYIKILHGCFGSGAGLVWFDKGKVIGHTAKHTETTGGWWFSTWYDPIDDKYYKKTKFLSSSYNVGMLDQRVVDEYGVLITNRNNGITRDPLEVEDKFTWDYNTYTSHQVCSCINPAWTYAQKLAVAEEYLRKKIASKIFSRENTVVRLIKPENTKYIEITAADIVLTGENASSVTVDEYLISGTTNFEMKVISRNIPENEVGEEYLTYVDGIGVEVDTLDEAHCVLLNLKALSPVVDHIDFRWWYNENTCTQWLHTHVEAHHSCIVPVDETVETTGTLSVTIEGTTAGMWSIDDGVTWRNDDGAVLEPGDYTVTYKPVESYTTPSAESITIIAGTITSITGTYVPIVY